MHDPIRLVAIGSSSLVVHQGLSHANQCQAALCIDGLVPSGSLPEASRGRAVRPAPGWVLLVFVAEQVPLLLLGLGLGEPYPTSLCVARSVSMYM